MLNNLYDNIINGRGRLNQENSMGMGVHTLGTRLQKNVLGKTQSFRFDHFNRFTVCNVFVFISQLKVPSPEIRF